MPETELGRVLRDLTPDPPHLLVGDDLVRRAKRRHRRRTAAAATLPVLLVLGVGALATRGPQTSSLTPSPSGQPSPGSTPAVTDMHATQGPPEPLTGGYGDLDGDGVPDRVVVSVLGSVTVELAGGTTLKANLPIQDGRLQGIASLWGTPGRQVLVSTTAAGCCGYRSTDSRTFVLTVVDGALTLVRTVDGQPLVLAFSQGRGDVYAGIRCSEHTVTEETLAEVGPGDTLRSTRQITLVGATAHVTVSPGQRTGALTGQQLFSAAGAHGCHGLSADGWAAP